MTDGDDEMEGDTAVCVCAAGVTASGIKPSSLVTARAAGRDDFDGAPTVVLSLLEPLAPPPLRKGASPQTTPTKKPRPRLRAMTQANLLSPDHGKTSFFVSPLGRPAMTTMTRGASPTGVENFPPFATGFEMRRRDWMAEVAEDAAIFSGARVAGGAFAKRARLLREVKRALVDATPARRSLVALALEQVLRGSVVTSAPASADLGALYEATVFCATEERGDDGVSLAAAQLLVSIHAAVDVTSPALDGACAIAVNLLGRAQTRLSRAVRLAFRSAASLKIKSEQKTRIADLKRVGSQMERAGLDLAAAAASIDLSETVEDRVVEVPSELPAPPLELRVGDAVVDGRTGEVGQIVAKTTGWWKLQIPSSDKVQS
ncbi:MAG: hypothetical protein VX747_10335, partial [Actinomycetota bacterium]|nr:hypothetical protein [Actinomycetota bacterium]